MQTAVPRAPLFLPPGEREREAEKMSVNEGGQGGVSLFVYVCMYVSVCVCVYVCVCGGIG